MGIWQAKDNRSSYLQKPKPVITVLSWSMTAVIPRFPAKNGTLCKGLRKRLAWCKVMNSTKIWVISAGA